MGTTRGVIKGMLGVWTLVHTYCSGGMLGIFPRRGGALLCKIAG